MEDYFTHSTIIFSLAFGGLGKGLRIFLTFSLRRTPMFGLISNSFCLNKFCLFYLRRQSEECSYMTATFEASDVHRRSLTQRKKPVHLFHENCSNDDIQADSLAPASSRWVKIAHQPLIFCLAHTLRLRIRRCRCLLLSKLKMFVFGCSFVLSSVQR
jgi:hypothetical protein